MSNLDAGMLWFWGGKGKTIPTEGDIQAAIDHYRKKYPNSIPSVVYLHPSQMGELYNVGGLPIRPKPTVIKGNLFLAVK